MKVRGNSTPTIILLPVSKPDEGAPSSDDHATLDWDAVSGKEDDD